MKQSTIWIIAIIWLVSVLLSLFSGYKLHPCPSYQDSPIEKPKPDTIQLAKILRLERELKRTDSLLKIKPKNIIHEKVIYYRDLNRDALCDSIDKYFSTGFDLL